MIRVFAVGFSKDVDERVIRDLFSEFGDIAAVKLIKDLDSNISKGYAFIDFLDDAGANLAIKELNDYLFNGRKLNVRLADNQPRAKWNQNDSSSQTEQRPASDKSQRVKRPRIQR